MRKLKNLKIKKISPKVVLKGGYLEIETSGKIPSWEIAENDLFFSGHGLRLVGVSPDRLIGEVIYSPQDKSTVPFSFNGGLVQSKPYDIFLPKRLSENHIFGTSPVADEEGNVYFIDLKELQDNKQSVIYRYNPKTESREIFISGIPAPTSLAYFDKVLWVTGMIDRKLYRCIAPGEYEVFAQGLGSVFGLAVNSLGEIFVGDQTGSLFKVDSTGKASFYATLPETFKGYHFAFSETDELFVSIPSSVGKNFIYKVTTDQKAEPYLETMNILGALAFSPDGRLYWIENSREEGAVFRMNPDGEAEKVISAGFLLGLNFNQAGDILLTDLHNLYQVKREWFYE